MKDMSMLKEDIAVMWMNLSSADQQILERYSRAIESYYCRLCAQCEPACPNHVEISTINRCLMYAEGYGELALARSTYAEIRAGASASACLSCEQCIAKCVNGINIAGKMQKAQTLFS
jgi:predicted aldo/keto reductase-like oxidoreductase